MGERPRPLPRRRRYGPPELAPAWQQLETERPPTGSLPRAPVLPRPSYGGLSESEFRNEAYRGTARELMANEFNRPPEMYRGERLLGPFLEMTGAPSLVRSYARARDGDPWGSAGEAAMGALAIGGVRASMREPIPRPAPAPIPPTRVYRGLNEPYDVDRAERLGDRWWHTNPEVASTYAPGSTGAHVIPGVIDENALNLARVETPPGTMWRAIPVRALPRGVRAGFPRGTEYVTSHEAAAAAESAGYDGITFQGMRDSGFAAAMDVYPGFGTGDDGRVVAVFNNNIVRSPFGALPREPMPRPPSPEPRLPGRASDGSVLPVAPSRPFTNSLRGGSDDLSEAAGMGSAEGAYIARSTRGNDYYPTSDEYWATEWGDTGMRGVDAPMVPANTPLADVSTPRSPRVRLRGEDLGSPSDYIRTDANGRWTDSTWARFYLQKHGGNIEAAIAEANSRGRDISAQMLAHWQRAGRIEVFRGPQ